MLVSQLGNKLRLGFGKQKLLGISEADCVPQFETEEPYSKLIRFNHKQRLKFLLEKVGRQLKILDLSFLWIDDEIIQLVVTNCHQLEGLSLNQCPGITGAHLKVSFCCF